MRSLIIFASYYIANHSFGSFQKDTTNHSQKSRKVRCGSSRMAEPEIWAQWIQVHGDTETFPTVNGNLCCMQYPPSALIPLETSLFVGKLNLSCLQAADWFLVTVKCDRWVENKYYYSPAACRGLACLVHFLGKGDSLSGDLKDYSSYQFWNIFLCMTSNPNQHYSLRDTKGLRIPVSHQKAQCNAEKSVQHLHYSYILCGVHSLVCPYLFLLFTEPPL